MDGTAWKLFSALLFFTTTSPSHVFFFPTLHLACGADHVFFSGPLSAPRLATAGRLHFTLPNVVLLQLSAICYAGGGTIFNVSIHQINSRVVKTHKERNNKLPCGPCGSSSFCSHLWIRAARAPTSSALKFLLSKKGKDQSRGLAGGSSESAAKWAP